MNIKIFLSTLVMGLCSIACSDDNVSETEKQQEGKLVGQSSLKNNEQGTSR